jgi:hypothetical protein
MSIINLTQHAATPEQVAAGVFDLPPSLRGRLSALLTFDTIPSAEEIKARAHDIALLAAALADGHDRAEEVGGEVDENDTGAFALHAMIGGAPYLMAPLEAALSEVGIEPLYAFSVRETEEQKQPDGSVRKVTVFRHAGFVKVLS